MWRYSPEDESGAPYWLADVGSDDSTAALVDIDGEVKSIPFDNGASVRPMFCLTF